MAQKGVKYPDCCGPQGWVLVQRKEIKIARDAAHKKNERKGASLAVYGTKIPHVCHQKEKKKRERERYWTVSKKPN